MQPHSVLGRIASRAVAVFATAPSPSPARAIDADDFTNAVGCTRCLLLLTKTPGRSSEDAQLQQCVRLSANNTLEALRRLPSSADVSPDVLVLLFGILRASAEFWTAETSEQLAQLLNERVDSLLLRTWRPRVLLAAVHAIARVCPAQAHLPLVSDALALLHHYEAQLSERDVATLLWCMATLNVAAAQSHMWASLCRRATLCYARMNSVSRLTLAQGLLLQHDCLCEPQADLLRVVHGVNGELEQHSELPNADVGGDGHRGSRRGSRTAHFHLGANSRYPATSAEATTQLTSQLLQYTTHALSDDALVRLLMTLFASSTAATEELQLVLAHLSQRTALSVQLCVQVLRFLQPYAIDDNEEEATKAAAGPRASALLSTSDRMSDLVWRTRQHIARLLVAAISAGAAQSSVEVVEVLCVEHHAMPRLSAPKQRGGHTATSTATGSSRRKDALASEDVWGAVVKVLFAMLDGGVRKLNLRSGAELWRWQCVCAYVRFVCASMATAPPAVSNLEECLAALDAFADASACWPNSRDRRAQAVDVITAAAASGSSGTRLLTFAGSPRTSNALRLLDSCVQELRTAVPELPVASTLRLLAAVDASGPVVYGSVQVLQTLLTAQLDAQTARTSGTLPEVVRYVSTALAGSAAPTRVDLAQRPLAVSDAVLEAYIRLLAQEHQRVVPAVQTRLLMGCLRERQHRPAALENAFMMLLTRRLGQTASFLAVTQLPTEAVCTLVELASGLPRPPGNTAATATRSLIVGTLLDLLIERCIPAATAAEELVAAALLLRLGIFEEFQRTRDVAAALDRRGVALLTARRAPWTSTQRAYIVAALVCAQQEPSPELLRALHGEQSAPVGISKDGR